MTFLTDLWKSSCIFPTPLGSYHGVPLFYADLYSRNKTQGIRAVTFEDDPLQDVVGGQMKYRYFPVNVGELASDIEYIRVKEDPFIDLGNGLKLATKILNHPITALGYRFEYKGKVLCTCYDTEPFRNLFITDPEDPEYDEAMAFEGDWSRKNRTRLSSIFFRVPTC